MLRYRREYFLGSILVLHAALKKVSACTRYLPRKFSQKNPTSHLESCVGRYSNMAGQEPDAEAVQQTDLVLCQAVEVPRPGLLRQMTCQTNRCMACIEETVCLFYAKVFAITVFTWANVSKSQTRNERVIPDTKSMAIYYRGVPDKSQSHREGITKEGNLTTVVVIWDTNFKMLQMSYRTPDPHQ